MVLLLLLTITIHKLNFFSHLTHFLSNIFSFYVLVTKAVQMTKLSPYRNKPRLSTSYQNHESDLIPFSPCKKIEIPEPGKFLLVESRIWDTAQGIRKPSNDWNPESKFPTHLRVLRYEIVFFFDASRIRSFVRSS